MVRLSFIEGVPYHGDSVEKDEFLKHLDEMSQKLRKRRWQFWFALCGKGGMTWTSHPSLFEVLWVPALRLLSRRSFKHEPGMGDATVLMLWGYWCDHHLPWRLQRRLGYTYELLRRYRRENFDLRQKLFAYERDKEKP